MPSAKPSEAAPSSTVPQGAGKPVPVQGDGTFQGSAPARTTAITAKDTAGNATNENWQLNTGSGTSPDATLNVTHDAEGNLLGDGTSTFEWDLKSRLTAIVTGTHRTEFTYDGADRRVRVVEKDSGSVTSDRRYVFSGLTLLEERAADNTTVLRRFYGGGHVDVADGGKRYAYTTDHLGSVREVLLLDGTSGDPTTTTLTARYDYDCWGKRTVLDGGTAAETLTLHGYTGHVYHKPSGLWLAPYRAYSPTLGRWISRDPIGEAGGINLFAYVGNGPMVGNDPLGWCETPSWAQNSPRWGWQPDGRPRNGIPRYIWITHSKPTAPTASPPSNAMTPNELFALADQLSNRGNPAEDARNQAPELGEKVANVAGGLLNAGANLAMLGDLGAVTGAIQTGGDLIRAVAGMAGSAEGKAAAIVEGAEKLGLTFTPVSNMSGGWKVFVGATPSGGGAAPLLAINPITGQVLKGSAKALTFGSGTNYLNTGVLNVVK